MKLATRAFLLFSLLFMDNKGVKTFFFSSPTKLPNSTIPQSVKEMCHFCSRKWRLLVVLVGSLKKESGNCNN